MSPRALHADIVAWPTFVARHLAQWQALHQRIGALVDLDPMWMLALVKGHDLPVEDLHVVVARDVQQQPTLVWPFQLKRQHKGWLTLRTLHPLQSAFCIAADILTLHDRSTAVATVLRALHRWHTPWQWIEIECLRTGTPLADTWQKLARQAGQRTRVVPEGRSPYLPHQGTFDDYLAQRSNRTRKKVRGQLRELASDSRFDIRLYRTPNELAEFECLALQIESRSWKHAQGSAITSRPWEQHFYRELIQGLAAQGGFVGAVMYVDGHPVAHSLDWQHGQRVLSLKSSYDDAYAKLSPGNLLMMHMMARYFAEGVTEYDFLGNDESYKLEWTDHVRPYGTLRLYGRSAMARLVGLFESMRRAPAHTPAHPGN